MKQPDTVLNITLKAGVRPGVSAPGLPQQQPDFVFSGAPDTPFLAPRGVLLCGDKLMVADTGRNRVFIWNQLPQTSHQEPDVVLGQDAVMDTGRNAGGAVSAATLQYPSGIWSDGQKLIVADAWNHRVLIWLSFPTHHGQPADVVLGQPDFEHNQPNASGVGASPTGQTLFWPYGVFSDGTHLWISDTGNRRILFYETIPTASFQHADQVVGKPDFETRDYEHEDPIWPYSVKISSAGVMAVTDTQYYRVLIWQNWRQAFTQKADLIVGQTDFEQNGQNQYGLFPAANTLSWCYDSAFYKEELLVADTGNSRVLRFQPVPEQSNPCANALLGKPNFSTGSENAETAFGTDKSMYWPFSICVDRQRLAIADTGNHRILIYHL